MNSRRLLRWAMLFSGVLARKRLCVPAVSQSGGRASGQAINLDQARPCSTFILQLLPAGVKAVEAMISTMSLRMLKSCATKKRRSSGSLLGIQTRRSAA